MGADQLTALPPRHGRPKDDAVTLTVKIGIGVGSLTGIFVGSEEAGRIEFMVAGEPIDQVAACEELADRGAKDVLLSIPAHSLIKDAVRVSDRSRGAHSCKCLVSVWYPAALPAPVEYPLFRCALKPLKHFVPRAVSYWMGSNVDDKVTAELRKVSVVFVKLDLHWSIDQVPLLQEAFRLASTIVKAYEGQIRQFLIDDKGTVLIAGWGLPPNYHADDPSRATEAAIEIHASLRSIGTGRAYCGGEGSVSRREFAMIGPIVNMSARLMSLASKRVSEGVKIPPILMEKNTKQKVAKDERFEVFLQKSQMLKGIAQPVPTWNPVYCGDQIVKSNNTDTHTMQGRGEEKACLTELFEKFTQNVNGGTTTVVLITGEKGMGKSMLVRHFLREIANVQAPVIVHCEQVDVGHSYAVYAGLLRHIFSLPLTAAPEGLAPFALNLRKACPPELHSKLHLLNDLLDLPLFETPQVKTLRSIKSMRAMNDVSSPIEYLLISLLRASLLPGTVVVIEDFQWMDLASWSLTNQAGSDLDGVFILMTGRSWADQSREEPPASASLRTSERSMVLQLGPLAKGELEAIASEELGVESVPGAVSSVLEERSQGNPLVASEVLAALVENHFVTVENRVATFRGSRVEIDRAIPSTLGELFMARIDRRSVEEKLLLKYASVIGKTFLFDALFYLLGDDPAFLAHAQNQANKGLSSPQTLRNLKQDKSTVRPWAVRRDQLYGECGSYMKSLLLELTFEKLLIQRSPEPLSFSFVNPLLHETVYSTMTYKLRAQIHDKVVSFYESRFPSQATGEYCTMLAHHSLLAENWSRTWFYHYLSGKKALAVYQNTNACEFFETALQSLAKSKVPTVKKGSLLWNAAKAQYSLGRYEKAEQLLEQAFEFYKIPLASSTAGKPGHRAGKLGLGTQIQSSLFKCDRPKQLLCLEQMVLVAYYRCSATRFQNALQLLLKHADAFEEVSESVAAYHILSGVLDKSLRTDAVDARYAALEPTAQNLSLYLLFLMGRARWRRCAELVDELVESSSKLGNRRMIEQALLLKCDLYHHEGHFHKSVELSATTASAASQRGDLHSSGLAMLIHARDLLFLGFTDEAKATLESYITPLLASHLAGDPAAVVLYHALNAAIATRHNQTARALTCAEQAFTQLLATEDTNYFLHYGAYLALQTYVLNLAQAFSKKQGKLLKRVFKHLKLRAEIFPMDQAQFYLWLGVSQYLAGNVAAAEANLGRASTFAGRYKMHFDIGLVLYHQGLVTGNPALMEEAKDKWRDRDVFPESSLANAKLLKPGKFPKNFL